MARTPTPYHRLVPTYTQPLMTGQNLSASWYRWISDTETGAPPAAEAVIAVGASPFAYQAPKRGIVIITAAAGATITLITYTRTAGSSYSTGQLAGTFPVSLGDTITVTYTGDPTKISVVFAPT
jgi:hypothetical protein